MFRDAGDESVASSTLLHKICLLSHATLQTHTHTADFRHTHTHYWQPCYILTMHFIFSQLCFVLIVASHKVTRSFSDASKTQGNLQHFVTASHRPLLGNSCLLLPHCGKTLNYCNGRTDLYIFYRFILPHNLQANDTQTNSQCTATQLEFQDACANMAKSLWNWNIGVNLKWHINYSDVISLKGHF